MGKEPNMTPTAHRDLAARLEAAEGASRELDWLIAEAVGEVPPHSVRMIGWDYDWYRRPGDFALWKANDSEGRQVSLWQPSARTSSLDAALTLFARVPDTIPSNPRRAASMALRARAAMMEEQG